jgi:methionyl-tRNA synthetase
MPPLAVRSGVIRSAAPHPSADRLLVLQVDVGEGSLRSIVAGIRTHYSADALVGRSILVLSNLSARTIRGIPSQGMVLAAEDAGRPVLLAPPEGVAPGEFVEGRGARDRTITHAEFASYSLVVGRVGGTVPGSGRSGVEVGGGILDVPGTWDSGSDVVVVRRPADAPEGFVLAFGPGRPVRPSETVPTGAVVK